MATSRATLGSLLSVVGSSAGSIVNVLDNINSGLDMLTEQVTYLKAEQTKVIKHKLHRLDDELADRFTQEQTLADLETLKFCGKSALHAEYYAKNYEKIKLAMAE